MRPAPVKLRIVGPSHLMQPPCRPPRLADSVRLMAETDRPLRWLVATRARWYPRNPAGEGHGRSHAEPQAGPGRSWPTVVGGWSRTGLRRARSVDPPNGGCPRPERRSAVHAAPVPGHRVATLQRDDGFEGTTGPDRAAGARRRYTHRRAHREAHSELQSAGGRHRTRAWLRRQACRQPRHPPRSDARTEGRQSPSNWNAVP